MFIRVPALTLYSIACAALSLQPVLTSAQSAAPRPRAATVTVAYTPGRPLNRFIPSHAFGAGIDGHDKGTADLQLTVENINAMLSTGLRSLTCRLRTELAN